MFDSTDEFQSFVGIDWAKDKVQACWLGPQTRKGRQREFEHSVEGYARLVAWLRELSDNRLETVAVAIETPAHAAVDALLDALVAVFSINPKQLDRFRDRYSVAGAKDDPLDAYVLGASLRTDLHLFRQVTPLEPATAALREAHRTYQRLKRDLARQANRLRETLWRYAPDILALQSSADEPWFWSVLEVGLDPQKAKALRPRTLERILAGRRKASLAPPSVLAVLRAPRLHLQPGIEAELLRTARQLVAILRTSQAALAEAEGHLKQLVHEAGIDGQVIDSLPGVAEIGTAAFLAEAHDAIKRRDLDQLRSRCGAAPVTKRSGKTTFVVMRRACNEYLRNACWDMARTAVCHDPWAKDLFTKMTGRGIPYNTALRQVADRLLTRMVALLRTGTLYDPNHWQAPSGSASAT
jgi:transposase